MAQSPAGFSALPIALEQALHTCAMSGLQGGYTSSPAPSLSGRLPRPPTLCEAQRPKVSLVLLLCSQISAGPWHLRLGGLSPSHMPFVHSSHALSLISVLTALVSSSATQHLCFELQLLCEASKAITSFRKPCWCPRSALDALPSLYNFGELITFSVSRFPVSN